MMIPSMLFVWRAELAPSCATRLATLAKMMALTHAPSSEMAMAKTASPVLLRSIPSPISIMSVV